MRALPSIAFNEFHGTAGEVTASKIGGETILNDRAQHSHVKTPRQSERRANFSFILRLWKTLSDEQHLAWESQARQHRERTLIAEDVPLTGYNLFVCFNTNLRVVGARYD